MDLSMYAVIIAMLAIYLILGCFLDTLGMLFLTMPIFYPILDSYDVNMIWFGILFVKTAEMGLLTPPLGLNVYTLDAAVPEFGLKVIFKGMLWFLLMDVVILAFLLAFPAISLWLPESMQ
jgi:TRAP-type C4-dicarboxylate transport system permease large subunit